MAFAFSPQFAFWSYYWIPIVLTLLGYFHPIPSLYFESLVDVCKFIIPSLLLAMGLSHIWFYQVGKRIQTQKVAPFKYTQEIISTVASVYIMCIIVAWGVSFLRAGYPTSLCFSLREATPFYTNDATAWVLYLIKIFIITLLTDAYMYFKHRMLHSRTFQVFHSHGIHHSFHDPTPFASFSLHPFEAVVTFWMTIAIILPHMYIWVQAQLLWVSAFVLLNLYLHSGVTISLLETTLPKLWINTSAFHNLHHEKKVINFGELLYLWDYLERTGYHPFGYNSVKDAAEARANVERLEGHTSEKAKDLATEE